jgi:Flp pilus assembly protein TadD
MRKDIGNPHTYHLIAILAICLLCIIIYSNTLNSSFVFDDFHNIKENPYIRLTDLDFDKLYDAGFKSPSSNRPVANISFAINYYFGKYDVTGYHIVNILIHLINGIIVYLLARIIFKQLSNVLKYRIPQSPNPPIPFMSLFAALLFTAHPLQTQSVTYIVQRMNSMAVMFYLLAFVLYIYGRLSRIRWKRWTLWAGCFVSWILALGSKQIAATLPFILLLYEWYFFQDLSKDWFKENLKYFLGLIVLSGLVALIYLGALPFDKILASYTDRDFTIWERLLTQFRVLVFYLGLLLYPHPSRLNLLHHFTTSHSLFDPITTFFSLLIIVCLIGIAIYLARRQRLISFCILWFFIHLVIESSIVGLEMIFEHRLYLPMFGFALLVPYLLFHLFLLKQRSWALIISVSIIVSLGTATFLRNRIWHDRITLWSDVVSKSPQSHRAHYNLGSDLTRQGSHTEAIAHFSEALRLKPDYAKAHNNLGVALEAQGRVKEAIDHYSEALMIKPEFAEAHYNLGVALEGQGRLKEAIDHYSEALMIKPEFAEAHNNLGVVLEGQGRLNEAIDHYSEALRIKFDDAEAHNNLAVALEGQGRVKEAIDHYFEALRIKPDYAEAYNNLGVALTRQGGFKEAIRCYLEALRIKPDDAGAHNNLGVALEGEGRLKEAIDHYFEALRIKPDYAEAYNNLGVALTQQGRLKEAIDHFSEALRIKPDDAEVRHNLELGLQRMDKSSNTVVRP